MVREAFRNYAELSAGNPDHSMLLRTALITTLVTPPQQVAADGSPFVVTDANGDNLAFHVVGEDWVGRRIDLHMPLVFVPANAAGASHLYDPVSTVDVGRQPVALAPASDSVSTSLPVQTLTFRRRRCSGVAAARRSRDGVGSRCQPPDWHRGTEPAGPVDPAGRSGDHHRRGVRHLRRSPTGRSSPGAGERAGWLGRASLSGRSPVSELARLVTFTKGPAVAPAGPAGGIAAAAPDAPPAGQRPAPEPWFCTEEGDQQSALWQLVAGTPVDDL